MDPWKAGEVVDWRDRDIERERDCDWARELPARVSAVRRLKDGWLLFARMAFSLDSRSEVCGRGKLEVPATKRLVVLWLSLEVDARLEPAADDGRSPPEPCGV